MNYLVLIIIDYVYYPDQYIGSLSDYYAYQYEVVTNITCLPGDTTYESCNYTIGYAACSENGNQAVISCLSKYWHQKLVSSFITGPASSSIETCSNGSISLSNFTEYDSSFGYSYFIGRVDVCINNEFVAVCRDTLYPDYFARLACSNRNSYSSKFSIVIVCKVILFCYFTGYTIISYDPIYSYSPSNSSLVLTNCSSIPFSYYDWTYYCSSSVTMGQCASSEPLTVRCDSGIFIAIFIVWFQAFVECGNFGDIRLTEPTRDYYSNGTTGITGNAEFCNNGEWRTICSGSLNEHDADAFCRRLGYTSKIFYCNITAISFDFLVDGSVVSSNPGGLSNTSRSISLTCPSYQFSGLSSCSVNQQCTNSSSNNTFVHCYDGRRTKLLTIMFLFLN